MRTSILIRAAFALFLLCVSGLAQNPFGNSLRLFGNDYVRIFATPPNVMRESVTIEFWFNMYGAGPLLTESDAFDSSIWEHTIFQVSGADLNVSLANVPPVKLGPLEFRTWHHVAVTYDHQTQTLSAYLNGVLGGTSTGARLSAADRPIRYVIGHYAVGDGSYSVPGRYDELRIWQYPRSADQIAEHWDKVMANDTPGLVALCHFDSLAPNNYLPDSTPAGEHPGIYYPFGAMPTLYPSTVPAPGAQPLIATEWAYPQATDNGGAYASFGGLLETMGRAAQVFFEWGPNFEFGNSTPIQKLAPTFSEQDVYARQVGPIAPGNYNVRAVAIIDGQRHEGATRPFSMAAPTVTTGLSTVTNRTVRLFASGHPRGHSGSIYFEWGAAFEFSTTPTPFYGYADTFFADDLFDAPAGTFPYRAVFRYATGTARGEAATFEILAPQVVANPISINGSSATLRLWAFSNGFDGTTFFEWGSSLLLGSRTLPRSLSLYPVNSPPSSHSATLTDLSPGEYFARPVLIAGGVEYRGEIVSFATTAPVTPSAPSLSFSRGPFLGQGARRLRVEVNPHLLSGSFRIQSGRDGNFSTFREIPFPTGLRDFVHFEDVFGVETGPAREFRVIASNAIGETISQVLSVERGEWAGYCFGLATGRYLETARPLWTNFPSASMTVELWFDPSRFGIAVVSERSRGTNQVSRTNIEILPTGEVRGRLFGARPLVLGAIASNEWSHVAVRYDAATRTLTGFLNGKATSTNNPGFTSDSRNYFVVGQPGSAFDRDRVPLQPFTGYIDEVRVWNIARSDLDLSANRAQLLAGDEPGLVLNWRLDDISRAITDESPRGNRGVIVGNSVSIIRSTAPLGFGLRQLSGAMEAQFHYYPGAEVLLEYTEDFSTWQPDIPALVPASGRLRVERAIDVSAPRRLYRIVPRN